jgi:hypothetical protein
MTHTYATATLDISPSAYNEIRTALLKAGYGHLLEEIRKRETIDMEGISIRAAVEKPVVTVLCERDDIGISGPRAAIFVGAAFSIAGTAGEMEYLTWRMVHLNGGRLVKKGIRKDWLAWRRDTYGEDFPSWLSDIHPDAFMD